MRLILIFLSLLSIPAALLAQARLIFDDSTQPNLTRIATFERPLRTSSRYPTGDLKWVAGTDVPIFSPYLRLHLVVKNLPKNNTWSLQVFDANQRLVQTLTIASFQKELVDRVKKINGDSLEIWTKRIYGKSFLVKLLDPGDPENLSITIDKYSHQFKEPRTKSIVGKDERLDIGEAFPASSLYRRYGQSVVAIFYQKLTGSDTNCTGFFLTSQLIITNHHCISEESQLENAEVRFNFLTGETYEIMALSKLEDTNRDLDYSILRLSAPVNESLIVQFNLGEIKKKLILIQHPEGDPQMISIKDCSLEAKTVPDRPSDFYHRCDSEGGASGSPVMLEGTGEVVGLHHMGRFNPEKKDYHNLGVKFLDIFKAIENKETGGKKDRKLYDEIVLGNKSLKDLIRTESKTN